MQQPQTAQHRIFRQSDQIIRRFVYVEIWVFDLICFHGPFGTPAVTGRGTVFGVEIIREIRTGA